MGMTCTCGEEEFETIGATIETTIDGLTMLTYEVQCPECGKQGFLSGTVN